MKVVGGGPGQCLAEFVIRPEDLNVDGGLNGGLTATIISNFTTYALLSTGSMPGTTSDLHVRLEQERNFCSVDFIYFSFAHNFINQLYEKRP